MKKLMISGLFVVIFLVSCQNTSVQSAGEVSVYDRVLNSGEIKVGYVAYPPGLIRDPNTGEFSGVFYEVLNEIGKKLDLEVDYVEEVTWATLVESVRNNRVDIIGSPVWPTSQRGKYADFTYPVYLGGLYAYVRADDDRFDGDVSRINQADVRIATIDGEISSTVANYDFPEAREISLPQSMDIPQLLLEIQTNKADITFVEPFVAAGYLAENPGMIKAVENIPPLRIYPNTMMLKKGEVEFQSMIDIALKELINSGYVDKVIEKYEPFEGAFLRNNLPYLKK